MFQAGVIYDGTGYDQYPPINPSSVCATACKRLFSLGCVAHTDGAVLQRMFEITTEFKTVQSEGLILAVGQHGNYDVDHIVIEIVDGYIWFDFAPGGNGGVNVRANA